MRLTEPRDLKVLGACAACSIFLVTIVLKGVATPPNDMDSWWMAATGRLITETGAFPRENYFSFAEPHHPWTLHEWLFTVVFAKGVTCLGPIFFALFGFAVWCATAGVILASTVGRARHVTLGVVFATTCLAATFARLDSARPLFASTLFAVVLARIAFDDRFSRAKIVVAALTELVWANAHGSFPLGVTFLAVGAAARSEDRSRRVVAALLALAATVVNPYGLRLHALVVRYTLRDDDVVRLIHANVGGFAPAWRAFGVWTPPSVLAALALVLLGAVACLRTRRLAPQGGLAIALAAAGLLQVRHLTLAIAVGCVLVAPALDLQAEPPSQAERKTTLAALVILLLPAVSTGAFVLGLAGRARAPEGWIGRVIGDRELLRLADALPAGARVFVPFGSAGLVLWFEAPRGVQVLYDERNDCYSRELVETGFALDSDRLSEAEAASVIERYGTDHVLVFGDGLVARALSHREGWRVVGREGRWVSISASRASPASPLAPQ